MKIITLIENTTCDPELTCEHGLSLYIETEEYKILFDMGQTAAFADNAEKLGVDLAQVDLAVLSHGHYDHGGGLARFLECNKKASVYLNVHAWEGHYNGKDAYIGLDPSLKNASQVKLTSEDQELAPGIFLYVAKGRTPLYPLDPAGLQREEGSCQEPGERKLVPEDFRHEQYLMIREHGRKILLSGCSHRGVLNSMEWFQPDVFVGGFHFSKIDPQGEERWRLDQAAEILRHYNCTYYTGHCTGQAQYVYLKAKMGQQLQYMATGRTIEIGECQDM